MPLKKLNKKVGRKTKRPPVEELAKLYENNTTRELAEYYGAPESTVKGWIFYYRHKAPEVKERERV